MADSNRVTVTESEPSTGEIVASFPHNSQPGSNSLREEDIPGASLNGRKLSDLHVVELKRRLKCRGATTSGRKQDLVKRCSLVSDISFLFPFLL